MKEIRIPNLDQDSNNIVVVSINFSEGDKVESNEVLYEIEASKVVIEVESPVSGTIKKVYLEKGDEVKPGDLLMEIEEK